MLQALHIENLAVIKSVDLDFTDGFMAITGETGAGKSIIIESINLLLGERSDKELIRTGESSAMVSGVFSGLGATANDRLAELGIASSDGEILIQRVITSDGRSHIKINGRTVTLSLLREIAPALVSIHTQGDTMSLLDSEYQREMLDVYADNQALLSEYSEKYQELENVRRQIKDIILKERERERLVEILAYQINDIASYDLYDGEEEDLVDKKVRIKNSEKITKNAGFVFKALKGSEKGSVAFLLDKSSTALQQISDVIPSFSEYSDKLQDMLYQIEDIAESVYAEIEDMESSPDEKINEIESRLDKISKLKRKYGLTIKDILAFKENAERELNELNNSENILKELEAKEGGLYLSALALADKLHERRTAVSRKIEEEVKTSLEFLDMPKVVFFISVAEQEESDKRTLNPFGSDIVEFYISTNRGADAQPLSKVASGGELARVMLSLKEVVADKDGVSTIIFDEIDAGVSGKTARKIGIKMRSISSSLQVITVTHSAQIASLADSHYLISKSDINGFTETRVDLLDRDGRIGELSRILGGIDVTASQREAAIDMLSNEYL
jgi:DNA repair protein RecN (Recombination protein N)